MELTGIGLEGLRLAEQKLEKAARKIAQPLAQDTVDLSQQAVDILEARRHYEANLKLLKTSDELNGQLLDLIG